MDQSVAQYDEAAGHRPPRNAPRSSVDARGESSALRRVALLLARYRQDSATIDPVFVQVQASVDALLRAAVSKRLSDGPDVECLAEARLGLMTQPATNPHSELLRRDLVVELQELSDRLER